MVTSTFLKSNWVRNLTGSDRPSGNTEIYRLAAKTTSLWNNVKDETKLVINNWPEISINNRMKTALILQIDAPSGKQWRYSEMKGWIEICSEKLLEAGICAGSHVAIITSTTVQTILVQLACAAIGATTVFVDAFLSVGRFFFFFLLLLSKQFSFQVIK